MTREALGGDKKYVQKAAYEDETEVDEAVGKVIKKEKSYDIYIYI